MTSPLPAARASLRPSARVRLRARPSRLALAAWQALEGTLLLGAAAAGLGASGTVLAQTAGTPVPCAVAAACTFQGRSITDFATRGAATVAQQGALTTVQQTTGTALLNWRSFNIGSGQSVVFRQPDRGSVAINRIHDTAVSRIDGSLSANGQVYLINPNGLLFGSGARVDVAGLIASTLDISDARATNGLLGDNAARAAFSLVPDNPFAASAGVQIDRGAVIRAGNVFVFAPRVENAGAISVDPGGQVVLAAGQRVFLAGSDTATLRGLYVEVGQGGVVTNRGEIVTPRGNTTLVGMAVNQSGRITATSAINENGSIRLLAREVATGPATIAQVPSQSPEGTFALPTEAGRVEIGAGSSTRVLLDATDTGTAALNDANAAAARSTIVADGREVVVGGAGAAGSTVLQARGGDIVLQARSADTMARDPGGQPLRSEVAGATLTIGSDALLDASGERDARVDGQRNYVYIDRLTSNDLRDAPTQRDGFLRGQGVYLNVARDHAFIDVSNRRAAVAGTQAERNATGGTIALRAEGRVDVAQGAQLDVSGGTTRTSAASGRSSQLITADGRVVDIANARADERYVGFADRVTVSLDSPREGIVSSRSFDSPVNSTTPEIVEGRSAGTVEVNAPRGTFGAELRGFVTPAPQQRASLPAGGELRVGTVVGSTSSLDNQIGFSRPNVLFSTDPAAAATELPASQLDRLLAFDVDALRTGGMTRIDVVSDGRITVARGAAMDVGPAGRLSLQGGAVDINDNLTARGGSITVAERPRSAEDSIGAERARRSLVAPDDRGRIRFGRDTEIDASGLYTNDQALAAGEVPASPLVRQGGSVSITGRNVNIADVARIDVGAGASVSATGAVTGGRGGSLTVAASDTEGLLASEADRGSLVLGTDFAGRVSGFGFSAGAALTVGAPSLVIGEGSAPGAGGSRLDLALFDRGFESFTLRGSDRVEVTAGALVAPAVRLHQFRRDTPLPATGADLALAAPPQRPAPAATRPASINLQATRTHGDVIVGHDAVIDAGVQGAVQASAGRSVQVDGTLRAAGGSVALSLTAPSLTDPTVATVERFEQQAIQLGAGALIDVSGVSRVQTDQNGLRTGNVLDGGSVSINAVRGSFSLDPAARIVADGARDTIDVGRAGATVRTEVASRGGAVSIGAQQGLFVEGRISGRAGGAGVEGGRLSVRLEGLLAQERDADPSDGQQTVLPELFDAVFSADRVLAIGEQATLVPELGAPFRAATYAGRGQVRSALINDSGFDSVLLGSTNTLSAPLGARLTTASSLTLDAQTLHVGAGSTLAVQSAQAVLGFGPRANEYAASLDGAPTAGSGALSVQARHVDLVGHLSLQGVGRTSVVSSGDVRLRGGGSPTALRPQGSLRSAGDVQVTAAQITPASMTDYTVDLTSAAGTRLVVGSGGTAPAEPLSAAGSVTLRADQIAIDGRVWAPHGRIDVRGDTVEVGPSARLSVAGSQAVPLGTVFNGSQWVYADDPNLSGNDLASGSGTSLIEKRIRIDGTSVTVDPSARLDISGGGQIVAQEFVAGPGGSVDLRQNFLPPAAGTTTPARNSFFALLPSRGDAAAPFDPQIMSDLGTDAARGGAGLLRTGQLITIGAGSAIPAGTYAVLPARYALLPGAFAVQPVAGYADIAPGASIREAGGSAIVAGRLGVASGASTARWSGYRVLDSTQFRRLAEWRETTGTALLTNAALASGQLPGRTPLDAGSLDVGAQALALDTASIVAAPAGGRTPGRGAEIALSAPRMVVTDQPAPGGAASDQWVVHAGGLSALGAETLVLGAGASRSADGTLTLQPRAESVSVGGTRPLQAGEVLLAASDAVSVAAGASVRADAAQQPRTGRVAVQGDGAALLVSNAADLPVWSRSASQGLTGDLSVAEGASLSGRSLLFDASRRQTYAASALFDVDNLGLSASVVNLGDAPASSAGLTLGNALLAQLSQVESLSLSSGSTFNVYGTTRVGAESLRNLSLDGAAIVAAAPGASLQVTGGSVSLRNSAATMPSAVPAAAGGTLVIEAAGVPGATGGIGLAGGDLALTGFGQTRLTTPGEVMLSGTGSLQVQGALTLDAARIAAERGASHDIRATGTLRTTASAPAPAAAPIEPLGARLSLSGERIEHGGRIELPAGSVALLATGAGSGDGVTLAAGSVVSVAGRTQRFGDTTADASAGRLSVTSTSGSLRAEAGSVIDISGSGSDGDAGQLSLQAVRGGIELQGTLQADAGSRARGAAVSVDVGRMADLGELGRALRPTGSEDGARSIEVRVRNGSATLAAGDTLMAQRLSLSVDGADHASVPGAGRLQIDGTLDASAPRAGRIELHARDQVQLGATARLDASSSGSGEEGGSVLLSARLHGAATGPALDAVRIAAGARVDVGAAAGADTDRLGGTITLRAPQVGGDVAIGALPDYAVGARSEIVEATLVRSYTTPLVLNAGTAASASNPLPTLRSELQASMGGAARAAMTDRLGRTGSDTFHLRPGLELRSSGDISVASTVDFTAGLTPGSTTSGTFQWRYGGNTLAGSEPGALTLRAGGNLTLSGGLQDGFLTLASGNANARLVPFADGDSWRFQLSAGADLGAAAPGTTVPGGSGNFVLQPTSSASNSAVIRTGTGRIDIAAAGDVTLRGVNAAIYTGGTASLTQPVFENTAISGNLGLNPRFTEHGGGVSIEAGRDLVSASVSNQLVNNWLWRVGRSTAATSSDGSPVADFSGPANAPTSWWVNAGTFLQGVGALGGGDLSLSAGRDIRSITAAVPTNATLATQGGRPAGLLEHNGGTLDVNAGRQLSGGLYYAQRGEMNLVADSIASASTADNVILAQGDNAARVQARGDLQIQGSFNPTWTVAPSIFNAGSPASTAFLTYGDRSELLVRSAGGDVTLANSVGSNRITVPSGGVGFGTSSAELALTDALPGRVELSAFGGDINVRNSKLLAPSATGQLRLLADGDIGGGGRVVMAAVPPQELPGVNNPMALSTWRSEFRNAFNGAEVREGGVIVRGTNWGLGRTANHGRTVLHEADVEPAHVVARQGDIASLTIELPKPLQLSAGGDVDNVNLWVQNLDANSVSRIGAGGRITLSSSSAGISVSGPGVAEILAGGAIDLGTSQIGALSRGNLVNGNLPAGGATLIVAAGLGRDGTGFVRAPDYANVLSQFVRHDAFAAAGAQARELNVRAVQALAPADRAVLLAAIDDRAAALQPGSAFQQWLAAQPAGRRAQLALALAEGVQAAANQQFVASRNTATFAPGYFAFGDLFPTLASSTEGIRHFVTTNPFAIADNAEALRRQALEGLPAALRAAIELGLAAPADAARPGSAFEAALAALPESTLAQGARQLAAQVQQVAGSALDALRAAGRVEGGVATPFARALDAQARAFSPAGPIGVGDITLVFSQVKAEQSGNLYLLAPTGGVVAGLANPPAGDVAVRDKQPYELGLLTLGGGSITSMVRDNFDVFRSRVFTVSGGDIHLWAGVGNIDAGRGPRDVAVAPPPRLVIDADTGLVSLDISASVSGSGIGALRTREDQPPSNIRLIAPNGFIDAGEAGIRADAGTVTLGTNIVLNAGNINAGAGVTGGAVVVAPPTPVPQSSNVASADKAVEQAQRAVAEQQKEAEERARKERRKRVTGEFLGFGEGGQ